MAEKLDPFDVAALEKSVNDSAVRVSTIWVSYLIFALYLVIAASTVTHRQLFLQDPVKLPVLNIDLPLWGFFFLAPVLFVIFHAYVLLQVLLLGRTAAAYNDALDRAVKPPPGNLSMRQRLANTLFAQIFAGSPREREGPIGSLLKLMAWVTLAIAPVLVLLVFQFKFLPYHSHFVSWSHRLLTLIELAAVFLLWPLILDAKRDIEWRRVVRQPIGIAFVALLALVSMGLATFPGEPHVNLFTGHSLMSVQCRRAPILGWYDHLHRDPTLFGSYDRLDLPDVDVVDDEKLAKLEKATTAKDQHPFEGERTRDFRGRNLDCGTFASADLRRADFRRASMSGANLQSAELQGAFLGQAQLQGADLRAAQLQGAFLEQAQLQGANLEKSDLKLTLLSASFLWRARTADCADARTTNLHLDPIIEVPDPNNKPNEGVPAKPKELAEYIERVVALVPDYKKDDTRKRMRSGLDVDDDNTAAIAMVWRDCAQKAATIPQPEYDEQHASLLRDLACNTINDGKAIAQGIVGNLAWVLDRPGFSARLARALLGLDGKDCPVAKDLSELAKSNLRKLVSAPIPEP